MSPDEYRMIKRDLRGTGWAMFCYFALLTVLPMIVLVVMAISRAMTQLTPMLGQGMPDAAQIEQAIRRALSGEWVLNLAVILNVVCATTGLIPFAVLGHRKGVRLRGKFSLRALKPKDIALLAVAALSVNLTSGLVVMLTEMLFNASGFSIAVNISFGTTSGSTALMVIYAVLLGPLCEELIFRGYLFEVLERHSQRLAVVGSAVLFGFMHGNLSQFFPAVVIGLLFGYIRSRTGSSGTCIAVHMLNNAFALLLDDVLLPLSGAVAGILELVLIAASVVFVIAYLPKLYKRWGAVPTAEDAHEKTLRRALFTTVPMVLYLVCCVLNMALSVSAI